MKHDKEAIDEIETLADAKEIINMLANGNFYLHANACNEINNQKIVDKLMEIRKSVREIDTGWNYAQSVGQMQKMESLRSINNLIAFVHKQMKG